MNPDWPIPTEAWVMRDLKPTDVVTLRFDLVPTEAQIEQIREHAERAYGCKVVFLVGASVASEP